ncbi:early growth response 1-B [Fusarium beomiforme]|uniref:Early growth response 1-B n=1 Tax=Fusarium beomiforme TaxID=44412 RepID=A0A9P5E2M4_9HYPO|nr:early growth response 1-B [Fusarium beomiforme]
MNRLYEIAEDFRRCHKPYHEQEFENVTIEDMRAEIHDIQLRRDKMNNMMNMNRLRMFLDGMEELNKLLLLLKFPVWQRLQKPLWDDSSLLFSRISDSLCLHAKFIKEQSIYIKDYATIHAAFQQYSYAVKQDWKIFEAQEEIRKYKKKHDVLLWISSSGKMQRLQNMFRNMVICPRSGRWIFRNYGAISEWMGEKEPPDSAIWLHGNSGYGKTVLASLIVDELKSPKTHNSMFSFPEGSKMIEAEEFIIPLCYQEKIISGGSNLEDSKLAEKLIKAFIEFSPRHYIVIDGINECNETEIRQTAKFLKDMVSTYDTQIKLGHLRVLFVGRETSDTRRYLPGDDCISVPLRPEDNHDDIRAFVQRKIPEFSKSSTGLAMEYLLQQDTKGDVVTLLREGILPAKLHDMYERLLESVKKSLEAQPGGARKWERSKLLFGWLVCAKRPLRWHELQAILCFDRFELQVDFENKMLRQDIEKYLGSIVHVLDGGHIRLIHSTARRHIIENKHVSEIEVQCQLTTSCFGAWNSTKISISYGITYILIKEVITEPGTPSESIKLKTVFMITEKNWKCSFRVKDLAMRILSRTIMAQTSSNAAARSVVSSMWAIATRKNGIIMKSAMTDPFNVQCLATRLPSVS